MSREQAIRQGWDEFWAVAAGRWSYNWAANQNKVVLVVGAPAGLEAQERVMRYGVPAFRHPCGCVTCEGVTLAVGVQPEPTPRAVVLALIGAAQSPDEVLAILETAGVLA